MTRELCASNLRMMLKHFIRSSRLGTNDNCLKAGSDLLKHGCARALFGENWSIKLKDLSVKFNNKFSVMAECFEKQCSFLVIQRMRRAAQLMAFYNRLYGGKLIDQMGGSLLRRYRNKPFMFTIAAIAFSWEDKKISDDEISSCVDDMVHIQDLIQKTQADKGHDLTCRWEKVIDKPHLIVWRKPLEFNTSLFQYKVYGKFDDVPARAFFNTQVDLHFWKQWDKLSQDIQIVDKYETNGSEVVHWTLKFPYPMHCRDYVYVRRYKVDQENKIMAMYSRTIDHPACPVQDNIVRVTDYQSALVIKPVQDFDENGLEYVLTYYDDPQTTFPSVCYNWMAKTGVPEFVEKLHSAAKKMNEQTKKGYRPLQNQNQNNCDNHLNVSQYA